VHIAVRRNRQIHEFTQIYTNKKTALFAAPLPLSSESVCRVSSDR
jgi:hypothetical protein